MSGSDKKRRNKKTEIAVESEVEIATIEDLEINLLKMDLDNREIALAKEREKVASHEQTIAGLRARERRLETQVRLMQVIINQKETEIRSLRTLETDLRELLFESVIRVKISLP